MERVEILYDRTIYGNDKSNMSDEPTNYPCVLSVSKATGDLKLKYAEADNGHFGISKVIFGITQRAGIPFADIKGKYGLTNFVMGIVDEPENVIKIAEAMHSTKFRNAMKSVQIGTCEWNRHVITMFRKDFYKEFL